MKKKRFLSLVLVAAMVMTLVLPTGLPVYAASEAESYIFDISEGNITVSADTGGTLKVAYGSALTKDNITTSQVITIIGTTTTNRVVVDGVAANIMLDAVKIELTATNVCAFELKNNANITLGLKEGTINSLKSGSNKVGLGVSSGTELNIIGPGALTATGGNWGAGIGGGASGAGGAISISEGTVTATGGNGGAGIGGGHSGAGGTINIKGGTVTATGGSSGAGIGGGSNKEGGATTITGGTVTATGGNWGAGIGGGASGAGGTIGITGGTVTARGGNGGAGIGGGNSGAGGNITINQQAIVKAANSGIMSAIHTNSEEGALLSGSTATLLVANFSSTQNPSTDSSIYFKDTQTLYTSFAPTAGYKSIAFTVVSNNTYQLKTADKLQMHTVLSIDFDISKDGLNIFNNVATATDLAKVAADKIELIDTAIKGVNIDLTNITGALTNPLPSVGSNGSAITWVSNAPAVVSHDAQTVVRPAYGAGNAAVTLIATLTKGAVTDTKVFPLIVLAETEEPIDPDQAKVAADKATLTEAAIKGANTDLANITGALTSPLPSVGSNGSVVTWVSNTPTVVSHDGQTVVRPAYGAGNTAVTLTATLTKGAVTDTKVFELTVLAIATPPSGGGSGGGGSSAPSPITTVVQPETRTDISVNGIAVNLGTATDIVEAGKQTTIITIDEPKLTLKGNNELVAISSNTVSDVLRVELSGQMLKTMETKEAVVEIKTAKANYTLPANQINIDAISAQLGNDIDLKDIKVSIEIAKPSAETVQKVKNAAVKGGFIIVVPPVEFNIRCTYGDKTVEVKQFNSYIERMIAIPDGIDPSKITTGVVVDPDGTVHHVPTEIIKIDGKYYAKINSLTNSTYAVVEHPMNFSDVESHFAKEAINDMGSRMVISGVGNNKFDPDREITRAEFAAIMVRALGLKPGTGLNAFDDVKASDWYQASVETATQYNIITGYGNGKFGPKDKITREQAITMIARAMNTTGLKVDIQQEEMQKLLTAFGDAAQASDYAKMSIATCIKAGVINSDEGNMNKVKGYITRAEVAVSVRRLLQKSNLI